MPALTIQQAFHLAGRHYDAGRFREAESLYRQILSHNPAHSDSLRMLALLAHQFGRKSVALELLRRAIEINPGVWDYHSNLGVLLAAAGRQDEAIIAFRNGLALRPNDPEIYSNLGGALLQQELGDEAIAAFARALELRPDFPEAHYNLGNALCQAKHFEDAARHYQSALSLRPTYVEAHFNLANVYRRTNRLPEAIDAYRHSLALRPQYAEARWNLALALLCKGEYVQGFVEYESRRQISDLWRGRGFSQPQWDGGELAGQTILLWDEQGLGDTIQFVRYASLVSDRGGRVLLRCKQELKRLLAKQCDISGAYSEDEPLPSFDVQCPLGTLPMIFGTTIDTVPATVPYLAADSILAAHWGAKFSPIQSGLKVGLAWAGGTAHPDDKTRSLPLAALAPLAQVEGAVYYSLQLGEAARQIPTAPAGLHLIDWTAELSDFADTAALIENLDLVIACDTSVAHLAGAMGKPAWVLIPFAPDWRWMLDRSDSPWYSSIRLFRQLPPWDWEHLVHQVALELQARSRPAV